MKDRYISKDALLKTLKEYHYIGCWNTDVCDADTVLRVLEVVENIVNSAPSIGPRQLSSMILKSKDYAIENYAKIARDDMKRYQAEERKAETTGNMLLMGFYRGMCEQTRYYAETLERLRKPE